MMKKPHVVIVGGGFGGVYTAKELIPAVKRGLCDVTLISRDNYFLFTPLLHEVATGSLSPGSVIEPIRDIFVGTGVQFCEGDVLSVDTEKNCVRLSEGDSIFFDYTVLAMGAKTEYYGVEGAENNTLPLKNLQDAMYIRNQFIESFEKANKEIDPEKKKKILTFIIVGGGPTGVELSAELSEFADTLCRSHARTMDGCSREKIKIILVSSAIDLIPMFERRVGVRAEEELLKRKVEVLLNKTVKKVTKDSVFFTDESLIETNTVIWTAGVLPDATCASKIPVEKGRLITNSFLQTKYGNIFALGDVACLTLNNKTVPVPMLAQAAVAEARVCAKNIISVLEGKTMSVYEFHSKGLLISLGKWSAAAQIGSFIFFGRFAWWLWRTVYLFKFVSTRKRIQIVFEWTVNAFASRDTSKIQY